MNVGAIPVFLITILADIRVYIAGREGLLEITWSTKEIIKRIKL
jgi:hypothetical protein